MPVKLVDYALKKKYLLKRLYEIMVPETITAIYLLIV
jgi:hypothetical protein